MRIKKEERAEKASFSESPINTILIINKLRVLDIAMFASPCCPAQPQQDPYWPTKILDFRQSFRRTATYRGNQEPMNAFIETPAYPGFCAM